jgi:hypothetical protein
MSINDGILPEDSRTCVEDSTKTRSLYRKPKLEKLGDLRTLTLGISPGTGDSGAPGTHKGGPVHLPPGFPPIDGVPKP